MPQVSNDVFTESLYLFLSLSFYEWTNKYWHVDTRLLFHDLSVLSDQNMPPLETNLSKPAEVPSVSGGTLWPDVANGKIYLYGGEYTSGFTADFALWTYDAYNDVWNKSLADSWVKRAFRGASTVVEATGMGYYFGGWLGNSSVPGWRAKNGSIRPNLALNTLLAYDFIGNQWTNKSGPDDGLGRAEGVMFYIPKGDTGLLVHFGGVHVPNGDPALAVPVSYPQKTNLYICWLHWCTKSNWK